MNILHEHFFFHQRRHRPSFPLGIDLQQVLPSERGEEVVVHRVVPLVSDQSKIPDGVQKQPVKRDPT